MQKQLQKIEEKGKYDYLQEIRTMQYMSNENLLKYYQEERTVKMRRYDYGSDEIEVIDITLNQRRH